MLLDRPFCLTTLLACNHEPGVTLRVIASNGWQPRTLRRWIDADPGDVDARVALLRRIGAGPRADDPERESRLAQLRDLLASHPEHVDAREALVTALADAGEPEAGRKLLETWPLEQRDGRFWRLRGR